MSRMEQKEKGKMKRGFTDVRGGAVGLVGGEGFGPVMNKKRGRLGRVSNLSQKYIG